MKNQAKIDKAYSDAARRALRALEAVSLKIHDMPAPGGDIETGWGDVGDMNHIAERLEEIAGAQYLRATKDH